MEYFCGTDQVESFHPSNLSLGFWGINKNLDKYISVKKMLFQFTTREPSEN